MTEAFDPIATRTFMKDDVLPTMPSFPPQGRPASSIPGFLRFRVSTLAKCFWVGLADEARSRLIETIRWMEATAPADPIHWRQGQSHYREAETSHYMWWQVLGACRWLVDADTGVANLSRAVRIEWEGWSKATPAEAIQDRRNRQDGLSERLAMCLAANEPAIALQFAEAAKLRAPYSLGRPALEYGKWASAYLTEGNARDATFVARGREMMQETFLPFFRPSAFWLEATLWLKAIYFDSGVTQTAEETILRAYELMPGVARPDFVPR